MKILIISQYFFPENFKINDIALGLKERGHEVSVLTGIPNYPKGVFYEGYSFQSKDEVWSGIKIYRSKLFARSKGGFRLMLNYLSFVFFAWLKINKIKGTFDKMLVYEPSPVTVGIPAIKASKKFNAPYYFWVQDLWPESLEAAGGIKNRFVLNFFDKVTRLIYKKSEKVLVQSEGFFDYIEKQDVPKEKIIFYPNSTESYFKKKSPSEEYQKKLPNGFKILFAGNLGEAQSLDTIVEAADIVKKKGVSVSWVFLGDGRSREEIQTKVRDKDLEDSVFFLGSFPSEQMPEFFACADVLVASLKKENVFALTIPSKIQSYMACGKPILVSLDGEGAKVINEANCGLSSPAEDAEALAENVFKMFETNNDERIEMGKNAEQYFKNNFERELLLDKLITILSR